MQPNKHNNNPRYLRIRVALGAGLLLLLSGDLILTSHSPVHNMPQFGIYMLVTLAGTAAVLGVTFIMGKLLRRREDYYAQH